MEIRLYRREDVDDIIELFYESVHTINADDYSSEQLDALAPREVDHYHWEASLERNHTIVAVEDDVIVGFGNIGQTGYLDRLYVSPDHLRKGIATKLVQHLEDYAKSKDNHVINTTSTITSVPFFESLGYQVIEEQVSERRGVRVLRYLMEKQL